MNTPVVMADNPRALVEAGTAVLRGEIIILPTDTVYGVGAYALDEGAVRQLYDVKQRSRDKGIPILIADTIDAPRLVSDVPPALERLMQYFWPGPVTIVLPKRPDLPPSISTGETVALRVPDHEVCRQIIRAAGGAMATTSANRSGRAPALTVEDALAELGGLVSLAVDGGPSAGQVASTVVEWADGRLRVLRPGPVSLAELNEALR